MSHEKIAEWASEQIGEPVSRTAVTSTLSRLGVVPVNVKHSAHIPWVVRVGHQNEMPHVLLRLLARRDKGAKIQPRQATFLDNALAWMEEEGVVVAYCRETTPGFYFVIADEKDDRPGGIPIRPRYLYPEEIVVGAA